MYNRNEGTITEDIAYSKKDNPINNKNVKNNLQNSKYIKKEGFSCPEELHFY